MKAIIAQNKKGIIGNKGKIPWYSPDDLKHFKKLTSDPNLTLLVGYNTAKGLPPLKGRKVVVDNKSMFSEEPNDNIMCIGGKKTYEKYAHLFTEIHVSIIDDYSEGDTTILDLTGLREGCTIYFYNFKTKKDD